MRILKVKKQSKTKTKKQNYTPAFESLLTATAMMMSMAIMTAMARARAKASEKVTATKATETLTEVTVKKVAETSKRTVIVTAKIMSRMMTTAVTMDWDVTLWIQKVNILQQLIETSTVMPTATVSERASGTLITKEIASATETADVTLTEKGTVAMTEKTIGKAIVSVTATKRESATETANEMVDETVMETTTAASTATATATVTVIVTANAMATMMTTEVAMEWVVAI